jgi:FkbM family methyltransferase
MLKNQGKSISNVSHAKIILFEVYKKVLSSFFFTSFFIINKLPKGKFATSIGLEKIWNITFKNKKGNKVYLFHTPNWLTEYRAHTLFSKEPETISWIDSFPLNSVLYDIGANVGLYSVYAAKSRNSRVLAFEPSYLNLELLFRNIQTNNLQDKITIIPLSLSNSNKIENFYMQDGDNIWGGAHNSSGSNITYDGKFMENFITSSQITISLDLLVEVFQLPTPNYIKIDVDGIEKIILQGALKSLSKATGILIEVDEKGGIQNAEIAGILGNLGFIKINLNNKFDPTQNQIWVKAVVST